MRIAPHHIEGTEEYKLSQLLRPKSNYAPSCPWPDDCMVQWGNGIIPATPFFEAFPKGTFIRGEGQTFEDAEQNAFAKYERDLACNHVWGRQRPDGVLYTNGAGWCRKCSGFRSKMFPEIVRLGWWRKPLSWIESDLLQSIETDHDLNERMDQKYPEEIERRKKRARMLRLRFNLYGSEKITPTPSQT